MTNGSIILVEDKAEFSAISRLNYEFYDDEEIVWKSLAENRNIQCVIGEKFLEPGQAQKPGLTDYADGIDTMLFLRSL